LQQAAAITALAGKRALGPGSSSARAAEMRLGGGENVMMPIIDTHQHLWDLAKFRLPWLAGAASLDRSFLMSDYLKATEGLNVIKSIYMEVDVDPSQQLQEAEYVADICRQGKSPMVAAVISGRPAADDFGQYIDRFKGSPYIKGLRQVLHGPSTPPGYCLDEKFIKGIRHLGELGLSYDICIRSAELGDATKLVDACSGTSFILDHCGNASVRAKDLSAWRADISRLAERKQVICKVSGIVASAAPDPWTADDLAPIINHVLGAFGPDRVVFGGDWPVCTLAASYRQWVEALKSIVHERPEAEQRKLFHDNAQRFYRLA
jgi:predicted TIM-barrel fold metal-dependent hydrolase